MRGEREVVLDNGWPIRLILHTDGEIPEPPYFVKAVLVPVDDNGYMSIDWGAPCFDETREVHESDRAQREGEFHHFTG